jgi:acetylornithine/N-succinyldiaminopimelate aminotransferase
MESVVLNRPFFDEVMTPNYSPADIIPVRGAGSRIWDQDGGEYIDFAGGIAVTCLGHAHPVLVEALATQASRLWHISNIMTNEPALLLAHKLCRKTFADRVFFANSGAEANEAALKLARKYSADHFSADKKEIISFAQSFHGRTLFTVSVGGQAKYTKGFEPLPPRITHVPFNDLAALEAAMSDQTCAVMMEPIQGEGGVIPADFDFARGVRHLCDRHQALLIFDEVQTGVGRTGHLFAYQWLGIVPDILTSAKALGGGFPISAMLTKAAIAESLSFGTHASTFGGNPLACAVANAVVDVVDTPKVLEGVKQRCQRLTQGLGAINAKYHVFSEIRGRGLLLGCELAGGYSGRGRDFVKCAQAEGLLLLIAGPDVLRFAPSLIIPEADIDEGLTRLQRAIAAVVK